MRRLLRRWLIRRVLAAAFTFESDLSRAYELALRKLEGSSLKERLAALLEEEHSHRELLERVRDGRISDQELEGLLAGAPIHRVEDIEPLSPGQLEVHGRRLATIEKVEEESYIFYSNLATMSKLSAVRQAFRFMAEQERQHLRILRRLRGAGGAEAAGDPEAG